MAKRTSKSSKRWTPEYAATVLDEASSSGLSDRVFATQRGIDPNRLWWWRRRLAKSKVVMNKEESFVELAVRQPTASTLASRIEILLTNGRIVAVPIDIDPIALAKLLDALEGRRC